jgi:hypothetical protein
LALGLAFQVFCGWAFGQQIVDKIVATVSDGSRPELITRSDVIWQLALQPETPLNPPNASDMRQALSVLIDQRLIALEAERLPSVRPTEEKIDAEIARTLKVFPSTGDFVSRLSSVGFRSISDENFRRLMERRVAIEEYLNFRFRSFVVVTSEDEARYYREEFSPEFRRTNPTLLMPTLSEMRTKINGILVERKVAEDIERFLDDAKRRAEIDILSEP